MVKTIRVIGDAKAAAECIESNRPMKIGDTFPAHAVVGAEILAKWPQYFEEVVAIEQQAQDAATEPQEVKSTVPGKNKMLAKGRKFKSKDLT